MTKSWRKSTSCMASNMLVIAAYLFMSLLLLWIDRMTLDYAGRVGPTV
jgi:hypothetical protein